MCSAQAESALSLQGLACDFERLVQGYRAGEVITLAEVRAKGLQLSVLTSGNTDAIVKRARDFHASSIQVAPVGLREMFLDKVKVI